METFTNTSIKNNLKQGKVVLYSNKPYIKRYEGVKVMRKIYVLDTNVLIHDPKAILNFRDNDVIIPIFVIEEIDKLKKQPNTGPQARIASRVIDGFREGGCLAKGVRLDEDIFFRVEMRDDISLLPTALKRDVVDNRILSTTLGIQKHNPDKKVILVSKDINMRIKADALAMNVEDYQTDKVDYSELYEGNCSVEVSDEVYKKYVKTGRLKLDEAEIEAPVANTFIRLKSGDKEAHGRYNLTKKRIERLSFGDASIWGVRAKNDEQKFAVDLLMDENVKIVTLVGRAGTGKTLMAVAAGLEQVVERRMYKKLLIARPIMPMGKDIGYLPGSEKDKLKPWMQPIHDNIDFLSENREEKAGDRVIAGLESMGLLKIEALTYIRGRSIPAGFIIIDEAQNLTPLEIKTIVTRAGENTKIVFTGDPQQIDSPYLDANTNGLTYLAEKMKNEELSGHITLTKGERSPLAEIAARLL